MRLKLSRQACGAIKGNSPSNISIKPSAVKIVVLTATPYDYLPPEPRMYLKNSELGFNTITSDLLLKLFL
jgi:hypothetical protein